MLVSGVVSFPKAVIGAVAAKPAQQSLTLSATNDCSQPRVLDAEVWTNDGFAREATQVWR